MYTSLARNQVGCCGGLGLFGLGQEAPKQYFDFSEKTIAGTTVRIIDDPSQKSWFKVTFVGWEIIEPPSGPLVGGLTVVHEPPHATEVLAVPFIQSGPKEVGNLFRWTEGHLSRGMGIVVVPPATWQNGDDLLRWEIGHPPAPSKPKPGNVVAMATNSIQEALKLAAPGMHGFVLYEPQGGWAEETGAPIIVGDSPPGKLVPTANGKSNTGLYIGIGIGVLVVGGLLVAATK